MDIFLWIVGGLFVLYMVRVQYIRYKKQKMRDMIFNTLQQARSAMAKAEMCATDRPLNVVVSKKTKARKTTKKVVKKGKKQFFNRCVGGGNGEPVLAITNPKVANGLAIKYSFPHRHIYIAGGW